MSLADNRAAHDRQLALHVNAEAIKALTDKKTQDCISAILGGEICFSVDGLLSQEVVDIISSSLREDAAWARECWVLGDDASVSRVEEPVFRSANLNRRFSTNDCLRIPSKTNLYLRGFLAALVSPQVKEMYSNFCGMDLHFKSADVTRYGKGDYLRRHADLFDDRRFALIWFFSDEWSSGRGGELIVEGEAGSSVVIGPHPGSVGIMAIRPGCFHQVAANQSQEWKRYTVATHFHESVC